MFQHWFSMLHLVKKQFQLLPDFTPFDISDLWQSSFICLHDYYWALGPRLSLKLRAKRADATEYSAVHTCANTQANKSVITLKYHHGILALTITAIQPSAILLSSLWNLSIFSFSAALCMMLKFLSNSKLGTSSLCSLIILWAPSLAR